MAVSESDIKQESWGKIPHWRRSHTTGSLLVVKRAKGDLDVRKVQAVCELLKEKAMPLMMEEDRLGRKAVLDSLTSEAVEQWMQRL